MWKPLRQEALWFHGGNLHLSRHYSLYVALQLKARMEGMPTPVYREVERTGPHHDPQFRVAVDLPGLAPAEGLGGSKRAAEKVAASVMIEREGVGGSNDS